MFKLVVFAFLAAVAAEPEPQLSSFYGLPIRSISTIVSPASTTITHQENSIVHPSPAFVSSPLTFSHFIKKRSADIGFIAPSPYLAPWSTTYSAPWATTYTAPLVHTAPIAPVLPQLETHLIKKRSTAFLPTTYIAPSTYLASTPLATTYSAPLIHNAPILHSAPLPYVAAAHLIKKRSAAFLPTTYIAPTTYLASAPLATTYSAPIIHSAPIHAAPALPYVAATHLIKKRSAPLLPTTIIAPTTYAATPLLASAYTAPTYGSPFITSSPFISASVTHFIKK